MALHTEKLGTVEWTNSFLSLFSQQSPVELPFNASA